MTKSVTSKPTVPAGALRWTFTLEPIPGYAFAYSDDVLDRGDEQQNGLVTSAADPSFSAGVTVHARGAFDPSEGSVDGAAISGKSVTVDGRPGTFVAGPSTPTLFWTYADKSWASVSVEGPDPLLSALKIAKAVRFTPSPVTLPFRMGVVPKGLTLTAVSPRADQASATYGKSFAEDYLVVSRVSAARWKEFRARQIQGVRAISHLLPDGTTLLVVVEPGHLGDISRAEQQAILGSVDVSPIFAQRHTWLPVLK